VKPVTDNAFLLRDAAPGDADQLTDLFLRSRAVAMPWLVSPHDEASTRWWVEHVLLVEQRVRLAHHRDRLRGFAAVDGRWLEQLYVDPGDQGQGVGRVLLDDVKRVSPGGLSLHVFTRNEHARRFYEAAGFVLVEQNDGSGNEEREPGCTYTWTPGNPLASRGAGTRGVRPIADRLPADRRAVRTLSGRCTMRIMSDAVVRHSRRHRLEVRVSPEQDALIRHAADLEDTTVTAFVLDTVTAHATTVIAQRRDLVLSNPAFDRFIAELDKPPAAVPQLSDLFRRHPKLPEA